MNFDLIAETDGDLNISRFIELYPEQGYKVESFPGDLDVRLRHSIGDASPIPYVCDGKTRIIYGDRFSSDLDLLTPNTSQGCSIKQGLQNLLTQARAGVFRHQIDQRSQHAFEQGFPEIFEERPSNSRYWVSRYRLAIQQSKAPEIKSELRLNEFRRTGRRWLELFGAKTELSKLKLLFGAADDGVFSRDDLANSAYGYFANKFANQEYSYLERVARSDAIFLGLFSEGLYYFDLYNSDIRLPFSFRRPENYLFELKKRLLEASVQSKMPKTKSLSLVLFGTRDAPTEVVNIIQDVRREYAGRYYANKRKEWELNKEYAWLSEEYTSTAFALIDDYNSLVELEGTEYGAARLAPRRDDFLADDRIYIEELRQRVRDVSAP